MTIDNTVAVNLRHLATFTSSGTFKIPKGVTEIFVSVQGASGGGSTGFTAFETGSGSNGGVGIITGGWVNVAPEHNYNVIIGAGGAGGIFPGGNLRSGGVGGTGGTTSFDNSVLAAGGTGANAGSHHSPNGASPGASGSASAETSLPTVSPSGALARVTGTQNSNTTIAGGAGSSGSATAGAGASGRVSIFSF